jgi:MFS family permease
MAAIGFAFDIYVLLVVPLIARPALSELLGVDPNTDTGTKEILAWTGYIIFGSAICGGTFGLLGGYLTDWFGRRTILTWSILLYALSALGSGFATSAPALLVLRCTTFIGVCVEFVAAVAWLAELFPNPRQRESILGYTQAFSSIGGLMVTGAYLLCNHFRDVLPPIYGEHATWRYTLISGVIPALPLIFIRPFLPESPVWMKKRSEGTLKRPSLVELFQPLYLRTSLVSAALFACGYGVAFGAIQLTPQIVPGLFPDLQPLVSLREAYEAGKSPDKLKELQERAAKAEAQYQKAQTEEADDSPKRAAAKTQAERSQKQAQTALGASESPTKLQEVRQRVEELQQKQEAVVGNVQLYQEVGGLVGRFVLAWLALRIVSRRKLLWIFLLPGLVVVPLVFYFPAAGRLAAYNLELLKAGIFLAGFFTVAQFSFWGNYLPRMYPVNLRGTGESFAANVGGRMFGTAANPLATLLIAPYLLATMTGVPRPAVIATAAAVVAFLVYALGSVLNVWLPEPKEEMLHE